MLKRIRNMPISGRDGAASGSDKSRHNSVTSPNTDSKNAPPTLQLQTSQKPSLVNNGKGPSLLGLMAAKRFTRRLTNRYGRSNSMHGSSKYSNSMVIQREPSYRMEPKRRFNPEKVLGIVKQIIDERMKDFRYHPKFCSNMCKILSEEIKDRIKNLRYDRYKIVALVHIGEKKDQSTLVCSRSAWDEKLDDFATYTTETATLFCTASVYGIYTE